MNAPFREALNGAKAGIVVGQGTHARSADAQTDTCLVLTPAFDFRAGGEALKGKVRYGLMRLDANSMRIPLQWPVLRSDAQARSGERGTVVKSASLALIAAQEDDPEIVAEQPELRSFIRDGENPYTSFVKTLPRTSATNVLCSGAIGAAAVEANRWGDCKSAAHSQADLRGRVVVVGELSDRDVKPFPGGERYGVELQANYIESLLDGRFLKPVPEWMGLVLFLLSIGFIHACFAFSEGKPFLAFGLSALWIVLLVGGGLVALMGFGYFAPVWTAFALVMMPVGLFASNWGERSMRAIGSSIKDRNSNLHWRKHD